MIKMKMVHKDIEGDNVVEKMMNVKNRKWPLKMEKWVMIYKREREESLKYRLLR